jgi:hypothetical protein
MRSEQVRYPRRAISVPLTPVVKGVVTVTHGSAAPQVRPGSWPDPADSQADSPGSIPITRSTGEGPGQRSFPNLASHRLAARRQAT